MFHRNVLARFAKGWKQGRIALRALFAFHSAPQAWVRPEQSLRCGLRLLPSAWTRLPPPGTRLLLREGKAAQEASAGGDGGLTATRLRRKPGVDAGAVLLPAAGASLALSSILKHEEAAMRVRSSAGPLVRRHRHLLACYSLCSRPRVSCAGRPRPREKQRQINT